MRPAQPGISPSFAIARKMRGCASIITTITDVSAASAPTVSSTVSPFINGPHDVPAARPAAASTAITSGAGWLSICLYGTTPTMTPDTSTKRTVQIANDPRMPRGMSRCGSRASCAEVETASNPIYAKKITPAPRSTPLQPYSPNVPVLGGMKGCQFAGTMNSAPAPITTSTIATLMTTMTALTVADSLIPTSSSAVTAMVMSTAGRLNTAVVVAIPPASCTTVPGAALIAAGNDTPI